MPLTGILRSWNDDRGFGFIAPTQGGREVFVHVSAFRRDGTRPTVGETLTYELGRGKDGQPQAVKVVRTAVGVRLRSRTSPRTERRGGFGAKAVAIGLLVAIGLGAFGYHKYRENRLQEFLGTPPERAIGIDSSAYKCDGRTYCSQMTSCAEAKFFLKNCPGTKMDGNNDGVPCQEQWCN